MIDFIDDVGVTLVVVFSAGGVFGAVVHSIANCCYESRAQTALRNEVSRLKLKIRAIGLGLGDSRHD